MAGVTAGFRVLGRLDLSVALLAATIGDGYVETRPGAVLVERVAVSPRPTGAGTSHSAGTPTMSRRGASGGGGQASRSRAVR
jgi:hypothetical protein